MITPSKLYDDSGSFGLIFKGTPEQMATLPSSSWDVSEGDYWYNIEDGTINIYNGTSWSGDVKLGGKLDLTGNIISFNNAESPEGDFYYDITTGTLNLVMQGGDVTQQVGEEFVKRVKNVTSEDIPDGTPVYISGSQGGRLTVAPADASFTEGIAFRTYAITTELIPSTGSQLGYVTKFGVVRGIDTTLASVAGLPFYLAVGGGFAITPPTSPDVTILLGVVEKRSEEEGELEVHIVAIPNLNSLSDVLITNLQDGQVLQWDAASSVWKNVTLP